MKKFFIYTLLLCAAAIPLRAEFSYDEGYSQFQSWNPYYLSQNEQYSSPIIYVFYNSQTCDENCAPAISAIEEVYDENFMNEYRFFVIDYFDDDENDFIGAYNLNTPLVMVLQQVENGQPTTFRKYSGLNYTFVEGPDFSDGIKQDIQYYFAN